MSWTAQFCIRQECAALASWILVTFNVDISSQCDLSAMVLAQALTLVIGLWACHRVAVQLAPDFNWVPNILGQDWVASHEGPKVLYVLECEGHAEWQAVPAEEAVVSWVRDLKDRLTFHKDRQDGEDLTVTVLLRCEQIGTTFGRRRAASTRLHLDTRNNV